MKKLLLALALFLAPAIAFAQCSGVFPANTACGTVAGGAPGQVPFSSIGQGSAAGPSGSIQYNNGGSFAGNSGLTYAAGGALSISPTANTFNQALSITQSTPTTGNSTAGPFAGNLISFVDNDYTVTGSGLDAFGILATNSAAFRVNNTITYTSTGTVRYGGIFAVNYTGVNASAQPVGSMSSVFSFTTSGSMWGAISHAGLGSGATTGKLFGHSFEVGAVTGTTVATRAGGIAFSEGGQRGSTFDAAFMVATQNIIGYGTAAGWLNLIGICNNCGGLAGLDTSGNIISADSATTIANAFNLSNVTITGNLISAPKTTISGATGTSSFGGGTFGLLSINTSTNIASGFDYFQTQTSASDNILAVVVSEASNGGTFFNQTINNWGMIRASGANNQGLIIGTTGALPLLLGTTNTTRAEIYGGGGLAMAVSGTPIASPGDGNIAATRYFSGTTGGLASKTCTINNTNVTTGITITITGGIVTGTTTC